MIPCVRRGTVAAKATGHPEKQEFVAPRNDKTDGPATAMNCYLNLRLALAAVLATAALMFPSARLRAFDGPAYRPQNLPGAGADTDLHFVEPSTLLPAYPSQAIVRTARRLPPPAPLPEPPAAAPRPDNSLNIRETPGPGAAEEIDAPWKPIGEVTARTAPPPGELPADLAAAPFARQGELHPQPAENRDWLVYAYFWEASAVCHGPLYFEEPNLERYGYTHGILQPAISGAHFFGTALLLPAKLVFESPHNCEYDLGYGQPGDCNPRTRVYLLQPSGAHQ